MAKPSANSGDPDQTPHSAASDLGLHCLSITIDPIGVSRLQWVNNNMMDNSYQHYYKNRTISGFSENSNENQFI